jgi:Arm DNA-binding domain
MGNLTALAVKNAKPGDKLGDGGGLRLDVDKNGNRSWVFRYTSPTTGKERYAGFGSAAEVSLADARDARDEARKLIRNNIDPIENRIRERAKAKAVETGSITFEAYAKQYIAGKEAGWKNEKHRQQWSNSLRDYTAPHHGVGRDRSSKAVHRFKPLPFRGDLHLAVGIQSVRAAGARHDL